jgi:3-deoxy-D-manno-octulosonic-acid transferase
VTITGNLKYDLPLPQTGVEEHRRTLGLSPGRPVFVAGSTGRGEEKLVLQSFEHARRTRPDLLLVLAPRHPERIGDVDRLIRERGFEIARRSTHEPCSGRVDVLLVDTVGELAALYQVATVAFVGGSLVPIGGHNLLEPAAVGVPVLFGPYVENCVDPAAALESTGGGRKVRDAEHLGAELERLLVDADQRHEMGSRAGRVVEANRGALDRSLTLLLGAVDAGVVSSGTGKV